MMCLFSNRETQISGNLFMADMTNREAVKHGARFLEQFGIENAEHDSRELFMEASGMNMTKYLLDASKRVDKAVYEKFESFIARRGRHEPLQHILGKTWFFGHEFIVNRDVLVPRPDTELLVEQALSELKKKERPDVLDMCTGSGCIIISLASEISMGNGMGADFSDKALQTAKINAEKNGVENISFVRSDLFKNIPSGISFDMIVSNPPYIETAMIEMLSEEVRLFDPYEALDGDEDGLKFYREITDAAPVFLRKGGWLMYEIGCSQAEAVSGIMSDAGFGDIKVVKDLAGPDRVVRGRLK